jgi:hypothetical protein
MAVSPAASRSSSRWYGRPAATASPQAVLAHTSRSSPAAVAAVAAFSRARPGGALEVTLARYEPPPRIVNSLLKNRRAERPDHTRAAAGGIDQVSSRAAFSLFR